jgi:hypothetical protein
MKDKKNIQSFEEFKENLNISDVRQRDFDHMLVKVNKGTEISKLEEFFNLLIDKGYDIVKSKLKYVYKMNNEKSFYIYIKYTGVVFIGEENDFRIDNSNLYDFDTDLNIIMEIIETYEI